MTTHPFPGSSRPHRSRTLIRLREIHIQNKRHKNRSARFYSIAVEAFALWSIRRQIEDAHILFEIVNDLATSLIGFVNDMNECLQSGFSVSFFHQFFGQFDCGENDPLASSGNMREKAVFNRVVFGTVRRIMGDTDFDTDFVGQVLEVGFENVMSETLSQRHLHFGALWCNLSLRLEHLIRKI